MALETLDRIQQRINSAPAITDEDRQELSALVQKLRGEIERLPESQREDARSLAGFVELSAFEATREETSTDLLEAGLKGVESVIERFQEQHPRLAKAASDFAQVVGRLGF
jgi:hypothetical protein